ncbi:MULTISPECIES: XisH family protein [unclassified Nostoc]|uniref:XisH family protein n=1 Tax=unclassified Nostoc TaxID=2593658 RepID=UPI002AD48636|nr:MULTISPECIES: XisH family protein [unclassified Nostoc]MDZ8034567.1 XisH family protein [Nostoc sp. DedSLP04]MDZ8093272.1 XisH family protein [Nostoc sp. DedQUE05]MDZ8135879.1 XisH family protein [Nostoc sp. DedQUE04]
MSARDKFHHVVKSALQKDGWRITHDPLLIRIENVTDMYIDLGAERIIAAEREGQIIAVEVKSFIGTSTISEFHTAVGQFINYRYALEEIDSERVLYLAVPLNTYNDFLNKPFIKSIIQRSQINLIVYDVETEEIIRWQI